MAGLQQGKQEVISSQWSHLISACTGRALLCSTQPLQVPQLLTADIPAPSGHRVQAGSAGRDGEGSGRDQRGAFGVTRFVQLEETEGKHPSVELPPEGQLQPLLSGIRDRT